jgi:hypothetical protein
MSDPPHVSKLLLALQELEEAASANIERAREIQRRIGWLRDQLEHGTPIGDIVTEEERPLIVELVTTNMQALESWGSLLRRAEAEALRAEGFTQQQIAELFGVTRQRISALLTAS